MKDKVQNIAESIVETINPKGGTNVTESIVVIMIVATVLYASLYQIELPELLWVAFGTVMGWLFKRNSKGDKDE